jgi:hypothetical protein
LKYEKVDREEREMTAEQEIEILIQYGEADMSKRLHLFLQFPDLRKDFQEIERKQLTVRTGSPSLRGEYKGKYFRNLSLFRKKCLSVPFGDGGNPSP